jgi:hypothetical protein
MCGVCRSPPAGSRCGGASLVWLRPFLGARACAAALLPCRPLGGEWCVGCAYVSGGRRARCSAAALKRAACSQPAFTATRPQCPPLKLEQRGYALPHHQTPHLYSLSGLRCSLAPRPSQRLRNCRRIRRLHVLVIPAAARLRVRGAAASLCFGLVILVAAAPPPLACLGGGSWRRWRRSQTWGSLGQRAGGRSMPLGACGCCGHGPWHSAAGSCRDRALRPPRTGAGRLAGCRAGVRLAAPPGVPPLAPPALPLVPRRLSPL